MNTKQLAHRILRHCSPRDPSALTLDQRQEVTGAISSGVSKFFRLAPAKLKRTTASFVLPAPVTVSLAVTAGAQTVDAGNPFTQDQRGASLVIDGDANRNEIVSRNGFLNAYQGATGTRSATIYGDAIPIHSRLFERAITDPMLLLGNGAVEKLDRVQLDHGIGRYSLSSFEYGWGGDLHLGVPRHYGIQHGGGSHASDLHFLLRVHPQPSTSYVVQFEVEASPETYGADALAGGSVDLPLSDEQIESILLPLCESEMIHSTLWAPKNDRAEKGILEARDQALSLIQLLPRDHGRPVGTVGTPYGW